MVVKAVILDFGGTLASGEIDWQDYHIGILGILKGKGHCVELKKLKEGIVAALNRLEKIRAKGKEMTFEEVYDYVLRRLGLPKDEETLEMIHDLFKQSYVSSLHPCTIEVLETLAGRYKLALISNTMSDQPRVILEERGLHRYFEVIVCSSEIGIRKPNPKIFEHVLDRLGVEPYETIHVGDNLEADMEGAANAGITPVWIKNGEKESWHGYSLSSICELPGFLEKIKT